MEYQPVRLLHCLLLSFLLVTPTEPKETRKIIPFVYNIIPVVKDLQLQEWISKCRLIAIPAIIGAMVYYNKQTLLQTISNHPVGFLALSYFTINYFIDTVSKYRQLNQTLQFFLFSQTMCRYMLCIVAVKNNMKHLHDTQAISFDEQEFSTRVSKETGHTIEELELFTFELLNSSINSISNLCIDVNTTNIEEKIYFLFKEQISMEQMLLVCKNDPLLHEELMKFYSDPEQHYHAIMQLLCDQIQTYFNYFIKKKFHID